jgi:hypothetical protein
VSDEHLSKRERHKQRRDDKRRREEEARKAARRRRLMGYAAVLVILLAVVGIAVGRNIAQRSADEARAEEVAERLDEVGCTPIVQLTDEGRAHFTDAAQIAASPPAEIYEDRPAASGIHMGAVALTGVYGEPVDERLLLHNLEHGYVTFWFDEEADDAQVSELQEWAQARIDGGQEKIIVAQYHEPLPVEGDFAAVAWGHRQVCEAFDPDVFEVFLEEHHDRPDVPEPRIPPHTTPDAPGVLDPNAADGPLLFPPLGEAQVGAGEVEDMDDLPD